MPSYNLMSHQRYDQSLSAAARSGRGPVEARPQHRQCFLAGVRIVLRIHRRDGTDSDRSPFQKNVRRVRAQFTPPYADGGGLLFVALVTSHCCYCRAPLLAESATTRLGSLPGRHRRPLFGRANDVHRILRSAFCIRVHGVNAPLAIPCAKASSTATINFRRTYALGNSAQYL